MRRILLVPILLLLALVSASSARAQILVLSDYVQERSAAPGETYSGEIRIRNDGTEARSIRVYQTDYSFRADGTSTFAPAGSQDRSNAGWIRATPSDLVLEAGQEATIAYEVSVPTDPSLAGTYWSVVMVEPSDVPEAELPAGAPAVGIRATVRFAVQVATHIATEASHRLRLGNPQVVLDPSAGRKLQFEVVNDGDVGYRPKVSLEVFDASGSLALTMETQRGLLYPGTSSLQTFELSELPAGQYQAVVVVDTGALEVFGAQFNLTVGAGG